MATNRYKKNFLGELEQMILLAILRLEDVAHAPGVAQVLEESAGRTVSRGVLYTTLNRLEKKGLVRWEVEPVASDAGGSGTYLKRRFELTDSGMKSLRVTQEALSNLVEGLESTIARGPQ
jgi:DNA-binding PadR family transcriptional regulator